MTLDLYLGHSLASRKEIRVWELAFEERTGISLINPFYDQDRADIRALDRGERGVELPFQQVVQNDLRLIQQTDATLALVDKATSLGLPMEVVYASQVYYKPVYAIVLDGRERHPWILYHATKIFTTQDVFERWIIQGKLKKKS
ncbi:hypothetical protein HYX13_04055 [Candidatus Woesearchaeota archaeon]|nr:hypothetical protein [Candidatus Woesearchaeota archaeon]